MESVSVCWQKQSKKYQDFWETNSPVILWETVRTLLTVAIQKPWYTHQLDFILTFPRADAECDMHIEIPRGCNIKGRRNNHVLKLNKNIYRSKQAG